MTGRKTLSGLMIVVAVQLLGAGIAAAQGVLTGVVRDSTGPLAGAEVSVQGVSRAAVTGRAGDFRIAGITPGTVMVSVRRLGYAPNSTLMKIVAGDNTMPDVILIPVARELDTIAIRDQQLFREYPLLREFEENRKVGLGQFVTRADLAKLQGGFLYPVFNQMRGITVVRGGLVASHTWFASRYMPGVGGQKDGCTELEDRGYREAVIPDKADCNYCFPEVYLDYSRLSHDGIAPNMGAFSPDQLQSIEVYQGAAEAPIRYSGSKSSCGIIVLHARVVEDKPRIIAKNPGDEPTRSPIYANVSVSSGAVHNGCPDCVRGQAYEGMLGYTIKDRWVVGGRFARWSATGGGSQTMTLRQAVVEWYPRPEAARFKWFVNAGAGATSVSLHTTHSVDYGNEFTANGMGTITLGTGLDIALVRRFALSPFASYNRTISGRTDNTKCVNAFTSSGMTTTCAVVTAEPRMFNLIQVGTRVGWR